MSHLDVVRSRLEEANSALILEMSGSGPDSEVLLTNIQSLINDAEMLISTYIHTRYAKST